ncbi:prolyl oligopeptidase, partial [Gorgonomyces haynaldii]
YPLARKTDFKQVLFGRTIADPYRWLEDPDAPETKQFVQDQNKVLRKHLEGSLRDKIESKLTQLMNYPRFGCPIKRGQHYYYLHNSGLQAQSVLYQQPQLDAPATVFFDPNQLSEDGTVSMQAFSFSESGKYFGYTLSASGSDWVKIHVRKVGDSEDLEAPIEWAKFTSLAWTHDEKGYFYVRYPKPSVTLDKAGTETDSNQKPWIAYHYLNTPQSQDLEIFSIPENPKHLPYMEVSDDGKYLLINVRQGTDPSCKVYYASLESFTGQKLEFTPIVNEFHSSFEYLTNDDNIFWFETNLDAPKNRICKYDITKPELGFVQVVAESKDVIAFSLVADKNKLVIVRLRDVKHVGEIYDLYTGESLGPLPIPIGSMITSKSGRRQDKVLFYGYSSFTTPGVIQQYSFETKEAKIFKEAVVDGLDADIVTSQVFYESKDGTKIPMFIVHKKGVQLNGENPVVLYGYGGFDIPITPSFATGPLTFIQNMNGIYCVANIRGGGEYGKEWHDQGRLKNKQNVFDDFQYAAKYLVKEKYTKHEKIAIYGGSNGGLLVGACITQAPELFGCGVAAVGVLDMLRFHKFTIGHAWISDYGNPDVEEDFNVLIKYSPLHNVKKQAYPSVLIVTGDHDDRVVPLHSLKFLATLQDVAAGNKNPIMGRIETKAGHGAGKSTKQRIEEQSDVYAFIAKAIGAQWQ